MVLLLLSQSNEINGVKNMSAGDVIKDAQDDEQEFDTLEGITKAIKDAGVDNCGLIFGKFFINISIIQT